MGWARSSPTLRTPPRQRHTRLDRGAQDPQGLPAGLRGRAESFRIGWARERSPVSFLLLKSAGERGYSSHTASAALAFPLRVIQQAACLCREYRSCIIFIGPKPKVRTQSTSEGFIRNRFDEGWAQVWGRAEPHKWPFPLPRTTAKVYARSAFDPPVRRVKGLASALELPNPFRGRRCS